MHWHEYHRDGQTLTATAESRRFPYQQHWELAAAPEGIAIRIEIETLEAIELDEYHASIVLRHEYSRWETEFESGPYPPFEPGFQDWRHANRLYRIGATAKALSSTLPSVTLKTTADGPPFRMTAINTGFFENARVLQALRTSDTGPLRFEKGKHLYFSGIVSIKEVSSEE
jgi:hypothetical protein